MPDSDPSPSVLFPELRAARSAALAARSILLARSAPLEVALKADATPVTQLDVAAETAIRRILGPEFPADAILGEEFGTTAGSSGRTWIIDPLDGTKSIVRGLPFYSTQIALHDGRHFVVGVSSAPEFDEVAYAIRGGAARISERCGEGSGERIAEGELRVSEIRELSAASLSFGNLKTLARRDRLRSCSELVLKTHRTRGYGDFYHYHALARGQLDIVVESDVSIYDVAALSVIVEAAGGRVTTLEGDALRFDSTSIVATNGWLHDAVLAVLTGA